MSSSPESARNWLELPRDITASILQRLGPVEILESAQQVCTQWRSICKEPSMWRTIDMGSECDNDYSEEELEAMCSHAVDRSCGGVVNITLKYFATDELLSHISSSCTQIKRLRLLCCYNLSDKGLCETTSKLQLLEELELSHCNFLRLTLESIGRNCPNLRSLKLNSHGYRYPHIESDDEAQAIAKTMPELRSLQIFANKLTNIGLTAILDGCPHLEFLDLRQCFNVNLSGKLGKMCSERIKDLRRPLDSTDDYEYNAELQDDMSFEEDHPTGFSDIDMVTEDDIDGYDFSGDEYDYGCYCDFFSDIDSD